MTIERRIRGLHYHQWLEDTDDIPFGAEVLAYDGTTSMQAAYAMLGLAAGAGSSTSHKYLAAFLAEVHGGSAVTETVNLTKTDNVVAGLVAKYSHIGTNASTYAGAALVAEIGDATTAAYAAVVAALGGDTAVTSATAAFAVDWQNSTPTSRFNYGLDLEGLAAHDGYLVPRYNKGFIRMGGRAVAQETVADLLILAGTSAPSNGSSGTGAGDAGAGSLYIRQSGSNSKIYINGNTKASPTWNLVTSA